MVITAIPVKMNEKQNNSLILCKWLTVAWATDSNTTVSERGDDYLFRGAMSNGVRGCRKKAWISHIQVKTFNEFIS